MRATESRLWSVIAEEVAGLNPARADRAPCYTRVETGSIKEGVADIEYVHHPWHGWIELKVGLPPKQAKPISLKTPYTIDQLAWLATHHDPRNRLRSWLLIGFPGVRAWDHFLLIAPAVSACLVKGRNPVVYRDLIRLPGVLGSRTIRGIIDEIRT